MQQDFKYSIKKISFDANKSERTIKRWIDSFNKENGTNHPNGNDAIISDPKLLKYLISRYPVDNNLKPGSSSDSPKPQQRKESRVKKATLQDRLSADWLVLLVLGVILWADMFAFGTIGNQNFGTKIPYAGVLFSIIGLATGIGSVVTFNRIKDVKIANLWKWLFGLLQFSVFSLAINEQWFYAEIIMTLMFVFVFIGAQRSIKK